MYQIIWKAWKWHYRCNRNKLVLPFNSIHMFQGYVAGTGPVIRLPQCQWNNPRNVIKCTTWTRQDPYLTSIKRIHTKPCLQYMQLGDVITRSTISGYLSLHCNDRGEISIANCYNKTPYLAIMGELWGVYCKDLRENCLRYNDIAPHYDIYCICLKIV